MLHFGFTVADMNPGPHAETGPGNGGRRPAGRIISGPLALVFLSEFCVLSSFFLLLSVMPMLAAAAGVGSSGAGLMTGSLTSAACKPVTGPWPAGPWSPPRRPRQAAIPRNRR